jgi:hypothetical protein
MLVESRGVAASADSVPGASLLYYSATRQRHSPAAGALMFHRPCPCVYLAYQTGVDKLPELGSTSPIMFTER